MPYAFANGAGTEADPYQVWTAEDLNGVRDYLDAYFIQMADIDLSGYQNWIMIGAGAEETDFFSGVYDGNGFTVSNLTTNNIVDWSGLFGVIIGESSLNPVIIKNLGLLNVDVTGHAYTGALVGYSGYGNISSCYSTGTVITTGVGAGGLVGICDGGLISNCFSCCNVEGLGSGGILGISDSTTINKCYGVGPIIDEDLGSGIVSIHPDDRTTVTDCYFDSSKAPNPEGSKGTPKTTAEMKEQSTFVGWDFDTVWGIDPAINEGYPYLRVFSQAEPIIDDVIPQYVPQSSIKLTFTAGDSDPYDMGTYYADSSHHKVGQDFTRINARNSVGKYLKDQSFDENCNYPAQAGHDLLESILSAAGLTNYYVAANATQLGFNFPPNKLLLDGLEEVIQYLSDWQIREEVSGKVVIAKHDDAEFTQPSTYTFQRDRDIFSREQVVDDRSIYGRVCVHTGDFTVKVYRPITSNLGWSPPARKTLYQKVPDGTTSQEAAAIATSLATAMSNSGRIETFVCAFRPQLIPGDEAQILDSSGAVSLGIITQVKHTFGTQGFYSEIVVDSGGRIGKIKFKDIVNSLQPLPETVKN